MQIATLMNIIIIIEISRNLIAFFLRKIQNIAIIYRINLQYSINIVIQFKFLFMKAYVCSCKCLFASKSSFTRRSIPRKWNFSFFFLYGGSSQFLSDFCPLRAFQDVAITELIAVEEIEWRFLLLSRVLSRFGDPGFSLA